MSMGIKTKVQAVVGCSTHDTIQGTTYITSTWLGSNLHLCGPGTLQLASYITEMEGSERCKTDVMYLYTLVHFVGRDVVSICILT